MITKLENLSFAECERLGRLVFSQLLLTSGATEIDFTKNEYDSVDVYWTYDNIKSVGELKYRQNYNSDDAVITREGVMLEKWKYDELKSRSLREGNEPYYVMMFKDCVAYSFNLKDYVPKWVEEKDRFPATTCGDRKKKTKVVTYIPLEYAKDIIRYNLVIHQ